MHTSYSDIQAIYDTGYFLHILIPFKTKNCFLENMWSSPIRREVERPRIIRM